MTREVTFSFVIPSHNRADEVVRCAASIQAAEPGGPAPDYEILIVQSGCRYDPTTLRFPRPDQITLLGVDRNSVSGAKNAGILAAAGRFVVLIDDDATVPPEFVELLKKEIERLPADAYALRVMDPRTGAYYVARDARYPVSTIGRRQYDLFRGTALVVRRELLGDVGLFNESFGPGGRYHSAEETDVYFRLLAAGAKVVYLPTVTVFHPVLQRADPERSFRYAYAAGAVLTKYCLVDPRHLYDYAWLLLKKVLICTLRLALASLLGGRHRQRQRQYRYDRVLLGLAQGSTTYCRLREAEDHA